VGNEVGVRGVVPCTFLLLPVSGGVLTTAQGVTGFDFDLASQVKRAEDCGHNLVNPVTANK
jgi:hypothetical protein